MTHRKSFTVNDAISFVLPDSFVILEEINDSGEQVFTLATNRYTADTGETDYHFKLTIGCSEEDAEFNDNDNPFFLLDKTASNPQARTLRTTQAPIVQFLTLNTHQLVRTWSPQVLWPRDPDSDPLRTNLFSLERKSFE